MRFSYLRFNFICLTNLHFFPLCCEAGRVFILTINAVLSNEYGKYKHNSLNKMARKKKAKTVAKRTVKRWTDEEDQLLLRQIDAFPHNLNKCFLMVSQQIDRSPGAVAAHWYSVLSKRDDIWKFVTLSAHHCSRNRKNGVGIESSVSVWNRIVKIVKTLFQ